MILSDTISSLMENNYQMINKFNELINITKMGLEKISTSPKKRLTKKEYDDEKPYEID